MYIHMSHFDTRPQMIGVSTAFRFQNPTTSNISKPFSQHHSRHFQLQLLCISISVLTLCPPNSQFGHFHVLPCGGTRCVSKGKTRQHWINGYSWRWGGMPSCNLRKGDFERNCVGHFDLTMIFCFFFPPCHLCLLWVILQRHWEVHQRVSPFPPLARRWELFRMSTRTWFLGFRGWKPGGRKSTNNKMFKGIQSMNPYQWLDTD